MERKVEVEWKDKVDKDIKDTIVDEVEKDAKRLQDRKEKLFAEVKEITDKHKQLLRE